MKKGMGGGKFAGAPLGRRPAPRGRRASYGELQASELYCPKCRAAGPVRERLLLVLPDGELHEYRCARCGTPVGEKTSRGTANIRLVVPS
jgi:hypothetical protein